MEFYDNIIGVVEEKVAARERDEAEILRLKNELDTLIEEWNILDEGVKVLAGVSDENIKKVLGFVSGVINKTLAEIFKSDTRKIDFIFKTYRDVHSHILIQLTNSHGVTLDMNLQTGTGLKQIVSALFTICLIEIRKGRRLVIFDERFSGLHKEAKAILVEILKIFAEGGFQFIFVEYSLNNLGKIYNIEKPGTAAVAYALEDREYSDDDVFIFSGADLSVLDKDYKEENTEDDDLEKVEIIG